jgi:uncharacterized membrane protein YtjA (UPF0391 family)
MRALLRFFSIVFLIAAVIAGGADTVQSFAVDKPVLTPGLTIWQFVSPAAYDAARSFVAAQWGGSMLADAMDALFAQPAFALFLALSLIFWMLGYKKPRPAGRFAA